MPWAAGSFTRAGGSTHWVDDKNAAINIVSSRHDTNDEDLASGINNAVTKDGQSKMMADFLPNADLSYKLGSASFRWSQLNGFVTYSTNNNITQAAPVSGAAYDVTGATDAYAMQIHGFNGAGHSRGLLVQAGVGNSGDFIEVLQNQAGTTTYRQLTGDGALKRWDAAGSPSLFEMGYMDAPLNQQNATYTLALSDRSKLLQHTSGAPHSWNIPANGTTAFPIGTMIAIANISGAAALTLTISTDTLRWLPSNTTGNRTLTAPALATLTKVTATEWNISGSGIS